MTKLLKWFFILLLLTGTIYGGFWYVKHNQNFPSTDDAYVQANTINVAARINGRVNHVYVKNHNFVKQGDPLFSLDSKELNLAIKNAQANLDNTIQSVKAKQMAIASAEALTNERQAQLTEAKKNANRILKTGVTKTLSTRKRRRSH